MPEKIDHRRNYILMLDTETANGLDDPLVYDLGFAVVDKWGTVYRTASYVNRDVFLYERDLMNTSYYHAKLPQYSEDIRNGDRILASLYEIRKAVCDVIAEYGIKQVCAHNARFDVNAMNTTERYVTKSKYRYFLPYGVEIWDTMRMAEDVICKMPTYLKYCEANGYMLANGRPRKTAEILYRFISCDDNFMEAHTGLADVLIEKEILRYCYKQHKAMRKNCFNKK